MFSKKILIFLLIVAYWCKWVLCFRVWLWIFDDTDWRRRRGFCFFGLLFFSLVMETVYTPSEVIWLVGVLLLVVLVLKLLDSICSRRPSKNSKITEFLLLSLVAWSCLEKRIEWKEEENWDFSFLEPVICFDGTGILKKGNSLHFLLGSSVLFLLETYMILLLGSIECLLDWGFLFFLLYFGVSRWWLYSGKVWKRR